MDDKILLVAVYNRVSSELFILSYMIRSRSPWLNRYIQPRVSWIAEDAIIAKKKKKCERLDNGYIHHLEQGSRPKKPKVGEKKDCDGKKAGSSSGQYSNYTPLNTLLDQMLIQIKDDPSLK